MTTNQTQFDPGFARLPSGEIATAETMAELMSKPGAHFRQGDVLAVAKPMPRGCAPVEREGGSVVLAHGEVTGHKHQLRGANVAMYRDSGNEYVRTTSPEPLQHEEHSTVILPPMDWELAQQVEYAPAELRNVAD